MPTGKLTICITVLRIKKTLGDEPLGRLSYLVTIIFSDHDADGLQASPPRNIMYWLMSDGEVP